MKKILFSIIICISCSSAHAGILRLLGACSGVWCAQKAYNEYPHEHANQPKDEPLGIAKIITEKTLNLTEFIEKKKDGQLSSFVSRYGSHAEQIENRYPETTKYGFFAAILLFFAFFFPFIL